MIERHYVETALAIREENGGDVDKQKLEHAVRLILEAVGEDPEREGLRATPRRVADMYAQLCGGLGKTTRGLLESAIFNEHAYNEFVVLRNIDFRSICEHHLVPFMGRAHVCYAPSGGRIVGLSKLARVVDVYARRPQVQERMTTQVAEAIMDALEPKGVLVVLEAEHLCMSIRGVEKAGAVTVTSAAVGIFLDSDVRREALSYMQAGSR